MKERYNSSFMDASFILRFCKLLICFHHVPGLLCTWRLSEEHQCRWLWKADDYSFTSISILGIQTSPAWIAMIAPLVLALFSVANSHNARPNPDEDHHNSHLPEDNIYHVTSCLRTFNILFSCFTREEGLIL